MARQVRPELVAAITAVDATGGGTMIQTPGAGVMPGTDPGEEAVQREQERAAALGELLDALGPELAEKLLGTDAAVAVTIRRAGGERWVRIDSPD